MTPASLSFLEDFTVILALNALHAGRPKKSRKNALEVRRKEQKTGACMSSGTDRSGPASQSCRAKENLLREQ